MASCRVFEISIPDIVPVDTKNEADIASKRRLLLLNHPRFVCFDWNFIVNLTINEAETDISHNDIATAVKTIQCLC